MAAKRDDTGASDPDDRVDARRAGSGDVDAFERLYRGHVARIHSLARRMVGADQADEVTQDVFVRAWEKLGTFRGDAAFGTWLHRVAVNLILARRKKLGIRRERYVADGEAALKHAAGQKITPGLSVEFEAGLARLPEGARVVFLLHDVTGFKHREIAEMLGVTVGTTKAQLHRARMMLREYVSN